MNTDSMNLYVVVRHQQAIDQRWRNIWLDDERLESITTTLEIGDLCSKAMARGEPVFVHRCGLEDIQPTVCCTAKVIQSTRINSRTYVVKFTEQQVLCTTPPVSPSRGQNYYWA